MSVAHPATKPPLIAQLHEKLDLEQPPDATQLSINSCQASDDFNAFVNRYRPAMKAAWYYEDPNQTGKSWEDGQYDFVEGFHRIAVAFPEIEELQQLIHTYWALKRHMDETWATLQTVRDQEKRHQILIDTAVELVSLLSDEERAA